jgi:RNA polymerase sigma-70 factor (ECF subfamily)
MWNNTIDKYTDQELVRVAQSGSQDAFCELIQRHHQKCLNMATCVLRDRAEAEDEVQNACWKAFEHLDQFQGDADFSIWLSRIVVNQCLMLIRTKRRARFLYLDAGIGRPPGASIDLPSATLDPEGETGRRQIEAVLRREIQRIPRVLRSVVVLRDVDELPITEVAYRLGISVSAAKSRLLRARLELRRRVLHHAVKKSTGSKSLPA